MKTRRAGAADVPTLVRLINEAFRVEDAFVIGDRTNGGEVSARMEHGAFLLAEGDRGALGCVYVRSQAEPGYFGLLAVDPAVQGRGLGRQLVALAEARLLEAGRQKVEIAVVSERPELVSFYESLGYAVSGQGPLPAALKVKKPCHFVFMRRDLAPDEVRFARDPKRGFVLDTSLFLRRPVGFVFRFFADASNLDAITPPWLHVRLLNQTPVAMYAGARITYRLRLHGLPMRWNAEITSWDPPQGFVDEQRRGPYDFWRHEHVFLESDEGTLVLDRVRYGVPTGGLAHSLFVKRDLLQIFRFRQERVRALLG